MQQSTNLKICYLRCKSWRTSGNTSILSIWWVSLPNKVCLSEFNTSTFCEVICTFYKVFSDWCILSVLKFFLHRDRWIVIKSCKNPILDPICFVFQILTSFSSNPRKILCYYWILSVWKSTKLFEGAPPNTTTQPAPDWAIKSVSSDIVLSASCQRITIPVIAKGKNSCVSLLLVICTEQDIRTHEYEYELHMQIQCHITSILPPRLPRKGSSFRVVFMRSESSGGNNLISSLLR